MWLLPSLQWSRSAQLSHSADLQSVSTKISTESKENNRCDCFVPCKGQEILNYHFLSTDRRLIIYLLIVNRHIKSAIWKFWTGTVKYNIIDYRYGHELQISTTWCSIDFYHLKFAPNFQHDWPKYMKTISKSFVFVFLGSNTSF